MWMRFCERKFPQSNANAPWAVVCQEQKVSGGGEVSAGRLDECHTSWYGRLPGGDYSRKPALTWETYIHQTHTDLKQTAIISWWKHNSKNVVLVLSPCVSLGSVRSVLVTKGYSGVLVSWWCPGLCNPNSPNASKACAGQKPGQMLRPDTKSVFTPLLINN